MAPLHPAIPTAGIVAALAAVGFVAQQRTDLMTATGYAAYSSCGLTFLADRDSASSNHDLPDNPLVPFLTSRINEEDRSASVALFGGLYRQTAYATDNNGCTIARDLGLPDTAATAGHGEHHGSAGHDGGAGSDVAGYPENPGHGGAGHTQPGAQTQPGDQAQPADPTQGTSGATTPDATKPTLVDPDAAAPWPAGENVPPPQPSPQLAAAVDDLFGTSEAAAAELQTRGVVVVRDGEIVAERYADGFTPETPQLGWSMTKSAASVMIGRAVAKGWVSLDDAELFPEWDDDRADITLGHLLNMTSGLELQESYQVGSSVLVMLYTQPDMASYAAKSPLAHPPGTEQYYSTASTTMACAVVHQRSGKGAELADELVFDPLDMSSATMTTDAVGQSSCGAQMWATPRDWAKLGVFALNDGVWRGNRLLPQGWIDQTTVVPDLPASHKGLASGWWVNNLPDGGTRFPALPRDAFWANGHNGQWLLVEPSSNTVIVRQGFAQVSTDESFPQAAANILAVLDTEAAAPMPVMNQQSS